MKFTPMPDAEHDMSNGDTAIIRPRWKKTEVFGLLVMATGLVVFVLLVSQLGQRG